MVMGHSGLLEKGSGKINLETLWETVQKGSDQKHASGSHESSPSTTYTQKGTAAGKRHWRTGETKVKGRRGAGGRKEKGGTWL